MIETVEVELRGVYPGGVVRLLPLDYTPIRHGARVRVPKVQGDVMERSGLFVLVPDSAEPRPIGFRFFVVRDRGSPTDTKAVHATREEEATNRSMAGRGACK
jgi:hypothetical protein